MTRETRQANVSWGRGSATQAHMHGGAGRSTGYYTAQALPCIGARTLLGAAIDTGSNAG